MTYSKRIQCHNYELAKCNLLIQLLTAQLSQHEKAIWGLRFARAVIACEAKCGALGWRQLWECGGERDVPFTD